MTLSVFLSAVCLSVCLSVCLHVRSSANFYACYLCVWLGTDLAKRCDMLRTSGSVDDVMSVHNDQEMGDAILTR